MVIEAQEENRDAGVYVSDPNSSLLLELAALDDLDAFKLAVEQKGLEIEQLGLWYGRRIGSKKMGYEKRTPLVVAALFGSVKVLSYILESGKADVNRTTGSDKVSALHCAVAGGSQSSLCTVELLLRSSADASCVDGNGKKPANLIPGTPNSSSKKLQVLLNGDVTIPTIAASSDAGDGEGGSVCLKKDYPVDTSLPDINNGVYSTDEFRMYSFKIKPCCRAYTHDWTECPFAHPGENARRRDPRKFQYSCVPCPDFKKGCCKNGDDCEYAHGVFESWLHPAQYRTRLCKDETGCGRKVCFFAHKKEELRPVYAATGSAISSPAFSSSMSPMVMGVTGQLGAFSAPSMSPSLAPSSPKWQSRVNSPTSSSLQLQGSRLRSGLSARDVDLEMELLKIENQISQQQQLKLLNEIYGRVGELQGSGVDNAFGSSSSSILASLNDSQISQLESPSGLRIRPNLSHLGANLPLDLPSSPARNLQPNGLELASPKSVAAMLGSRSATFARSQSFIDRGAAAASLASPSFNGGRGGTNLTSATSANLSDWEFPDGKFHWRVQQEELSKLRKSVSFGFRGNDTVRKSTPSMPSATYEPDVSWVNSLVSDAPCGGKRMLGTTKQPYGSNSGVQETYTPWMEQLYIEQEQMVA
ncbi:hypothetical protein Nepgr_017246 [Nepenthes gracilis]|uniref:C3H1-type domain-containing protein n=1 Tax=Nepenthes gracilis TaxID=150966 RepID=A0AAD3XT76_NEPGR|nr:hypothetical protein Nepgr_017246 [Nepenthes gracilis]